MPVPVVRFAPSPTGRLHSGNARTALLNFLFARRHDAGTFILRLDDTDTARSTEAYARAIVEDLAWLGIVPDQTIRQSDRMALYAAAAERLMAMGRLYPCYETPEELDYRRRYQMTRGQPPVYDRAALRLGDEERRRLEAEGRRPHWRFQLDHTTITWHDLVRGPCHVECASLSDPVLCREDGSWLYTLPSVVDDLAMGITHVIRGEDHVTNTAVQIQIFAALAESAEEIPAFAHHNLLTDAAGSGLSKRTGALSLASLREEGIEPLALAALAVLTGSSDNIHPVDSLAALGESLDLSHLSRTAARFDPAVLGPLSAATLHILPYETVAARLETLGISGPLAAAFWIAVRGNITRLDEAALWWSIIMNDSGLPPLSNPEDRLFLAQADSCLPDAPWDQETWNKAHWTAWTERLKELSGRKGKALFHPLRLALTGQEHGPELAPLLGLMGQARVRRRLRAGATSITG